ncbi:MAG: ATP-binding cassette domain-containing protein [Notoacmeibacter sp.]|nr:ATP-binding cassette domain-containing protein [Notoacmeibacter sp.]
MTAHTRGQIAMAGVDVTFGAKPVLSGLDFEVYESEVVSVVGASGCGKATSLRLLAGLISPSRGTVTFEGKAVNGPRREAAALAE